MTAAFPELQASVRRRTATADAIEELVRARHADLLRVATAIAGSREGGRDAVQEGLSRALAARATFRGSGTLEAWVWRTVVNAARNVRARSPLVAESREVAFAVDPPDDRRDAVREAVAQLPERQRLALFLRYYADLDYATIATALGVRRGTVSATLSHAHDALRRLLAEEVLT